MADQLTHSQSQTDITAFHLTPSADINPKEAKEYERESFIPVRNEAEQLNISINTLYKATNDISKEIASVANKGEYDLLLVGGSRSLFTDDVTGGKVKNYLEAANCQVGILVDKDFNVADTILMPILDGSDFFVLSFAERFIQNNKAKVKLVDVGDFVKNNDTFLNVLKKVNEENPNSITLIEKCDMDKDFLNQFDLMVISHNHWKSDSKNKATWLAHAPSVLIIKP